MAERSDAEYYQRAYQREKKARQEAERIIEAKSTELFFINKELKHLNQSLEEKVTERTRQLELERERAENLASAKQQFLANMSHEIRTPMNAIMGFTHLLLKSVWPEKELSYLQAIHSSAKNLLVIINDILDLSKIEEGKVYLEHIDFDLLELVCETFNVLTAGEPKKNVRFILDVQPGALIVKSDPVRLRQILTNLISNAIKFTDQGTVRLSVKTLAKAQGRINALFEVADTGIGIAGEKLSAIFESFSQEDQSITRKYGGTGLGLSITKRLVALFGGTIEVKSRKGTGTTFRLSIPMECGSGVFEKKIQRQIDKDAFSGTTLLLVEDNILNQMLVSGILRPWPVTLLIANTGPEALGILKNQRADLVLMDIQMPEMDGIETTARIRNELGLNIPIIALTANAMKEDEEKYLKCGMNGYLSKPFEEDELFEIMTKNLKRKKQCYVPSAPEIDVRALDSITDGDPALLREVLRMFIQNFEDHIIHNSCFDYGSQGEFRLDDIRKNIHSIKPSLTLLKAKALLSDIRIIEEAGCEAGFATLDERVRSLKAGITRISEYLASLLGDESLSSVA